MILPPAPPLEDRARVLVDEIDHCAPAWMLEDDVKDTRAATWRPPAKEIASERDRAPEW